MLLLVAVVGCGSGDEGREADGNGALVETFEYPCGYGGLMYCEDSASGVSLVRYDAMFEGECISVTTHQCLDGCRTRTPTDTDDPTDLCNGAGGAGGAGGGN